MATFARIKQSGKVVAYKVLIKKNGKTLITKRFKLMVAARKWAARIESNIEMMEALGSPGAGITFRELGQQYLDYWFKQERKDTDVPRKVEWWSDRLGDKRIMGLRGTVWVDIGISG